MFPQFPQFPQLLQCRATQVLVALHTMKKADNYLKNGGKFIKNLYSSAVSAVSAVGFTEYKKHSFECFSDWLNHLTVILPLRFLGCSFLPYIACGL